MGATTDGRKLVTSIEVDQKPSLSAKTSDESFYSTNCSLDIKPPVDTLNDIETISDLEQDYDSDEDKASIISALTNDHNYNMAPIIEPVSPLSSTSSRSTPDATHMLSDCGYESQTSPTPSFPDDMSYFDLDNINIWDDPITELFPSLV